MYDFVLILLVKKQLKQYKHTGGIYVILGTP